MLPVAKIQKKDVLLSTAILLTFAAVLYLPVFRALAAMFDIVFVGLMNLAEAMPAVLTPRLWGFVCLGTLLACICAFFKTPVGHGLRFAAGFTIAGVLGLLLLWGISQGQDPLELTLKPQMENESPSLAGLTPEGVASLRASPELASGSVVWKNEMLVAGLSGSSISQKKCESIQANFSNNAAAKERYLLFLNGKLSVPGKPVSCERWKLNDLVLTYRTKYAPDGLAALVAPGV